jgi:hypothetical protein
MKVLPTNFRQILSEAGLKFVSAHTNFKWEAISQHICFISNKGTIR